MEEPVSFDISNELSTGKQDIPPLLPNKFSLTSLQLHDTLFLVS